MYKDSILFIDDDEVHNFVMKSYLEHLKAPINASFLVNAEKALDLLNETDYENWPSIIVVDLKMPVMEGFSFIEQLQANHPKCNNHTCIVVLTASISPLDKEKSKEFSIINQYLVNPLTGVSITKMIDKCLSSIEHSA